MEIKAIKSEQFDVFGRSLKSGEKHLNGDAFEFWQSTGERYVCLIVADGVGTHACDWKASRTVCEKVKEYLSESNDDIESKTVSALNYANEALKKESGRCGGMMSTCSFLMWEKDKNQIYYTNIGDSRIYKIQDRSLKRLSKDDTEIVAIRQDGKLRLQQGSPVFAKGITKALGQSVPLDIIFQQDTINEGEIFILATDGAHGDGEFEYDLYNIVTKANLERQLNGYLEQCSSSKNDDATVLILRRKDLTKTDFELCTKVILNNLNYNDSGILEYKMANFIIQKSYESLHSGTYVGINIFIDYLENYFIYPSKEALVKLLDELSKIPDFDKMIFDRILGLIRKSS